MTKNKTATVETEAVVETAKTDETVTPTDQAAEIVSPTEQVAAPDQDSPEVLAGLTALGAALRIPVENPEDFAGEHDEKLEAIAEMVKDRDRINAVIEAAQAEIKAITPRLKVQKDLAATAKKFGLPLPRPWADLLSTTERAGTTGEVNVKGGAEEYRFHGFEGQPKLGNKNRNLYAGLYETTAGSGGTGRDGRFRSWEFIVWAKEQGHAWPMKVGDSLTVTFPNGKTGTVTRTT